MSVRRRWGVVILVWAWQLVAALFVAAPIASAFGGTGVAAHPHGDAVLFEPGALLLVEALRVGAEALVSAFGSSIALLAIASALGLIPVALLLVALASSERLQLSSWLGRAIAQVPAFALISGATLLARAVLLVALLIAWGAVDDALDSALSERGADLVLAVGALAGALAWTALGITRDLARASAVRRGRGALAALRAGVAAFSARPLATLLGWLLPASWSVAVLAAAALTVGALHVERPGAWRVVLALAVHQLAVLLLVALRAAWLGRALELEPAGALPAPADRPLQAVAPMV